jgi:hypothetical protein
VDAVKEEPVLDGACGDAAYVDGVPIDIGTHSYAVFVTHTARDLYVCFDQPADATPEPISEVAVYVDRDNDGAAVDGGDFRIAVPESVGMRGGRQTVGKFYDPRASAYIAADVPDWTAEVAHCLDPLPPCGGISNWSAEIRVSVGTLGGWDRSVGMAFVQHAVTGATDAYSWPAGSSGGDAATWASIPLLGMGQP